MKPKSGNIDKCFRKMKPKSGNIDKCFRKMKPKSGNIDKVFYLFYLLNYGNTKVYTHSSGQPHSRQLSIINYQL
jgi:hypothetical protein